MSMRMQHRCWKCWARRTLKKPKRMYKHPDGPKCLKCGARKMFLCKDRLTLNRGRKEACNCQGYHFKHRRGSKFCEHNKNYAQHMEERYSHFAEAR